MSDWFNTPLKGRQAYVLDTDTWVRAGDLNESHIGQWVEVTTPREDDEGDIDDEAGLCTTTGVLRKIVDRPTSYWMRLQVGSHTVWATNRTPVKLYEHIADVPKAKTDDSPVFLTLGIGWCAIGLAAAAVYAVVRRWLR